MKIATFGVAAGVAAVVAGWLLPLPSATAAALEVHVSQNAQRLMPYQVFELSFQHEGKYAQPTWDVTIDVTFTALAFTVDLAPLITEAGPPDIDGDGYANDEEKAAGTDPSNLLSFPGPP